MYLSLGYTNVKHLYMAVESHIVMNRIKEKISKNVGNSH